MQHSNSNRWDIGKESITRNYIQLVSVSDINQVLPRPHIKIKLRLSHIKLRLNHFKLSQLNQSSSLLNHFTPNQLHRFKSHPTLLADRTCMYLSTLIENLSYEPSTMDRERLKLLSIEQKVINLSTENDVEWYDSKWSRLADIQSWDVENTIQNHPYRTTDDDDERWWIRKWPPQVIWHDDVVDYQKLHQTSKESTQIFILFCV